MSAAALRVAIVDDEPAVRRDLELVLLALPGCELVASLGDSAQALERLPEVRPELLLLDIRMPGLDGFQLLERLPRGAVEAVVFVSAFDHFALRAFEVAAFDFLLKPVDPARLRAAVERVRTRVEAGRSASRLAERFAELRQLFESERRGSTWSPIEGFARRLIVRESGRIRIVPVEAIRWVAADRNYAVLHTPREKVAVRQAMAVLEERLDPRHFTRIHRSTIVAIAEVRELRPLIRGEYRVVLQDGTELRLSRRYRASLERLTSEGT